MKTGTFYGFSIANREEQPAWFYHEQSAVNFGAACGFTDNPVETTDEAEESDILDTPDTIWTKTGRVAV